MGKTNISPPQFTTKFITRFWSYVDKTPSQGPKGDCWRWIKGTHGGYGTFSLCEGLRRYRTVAAHRVAFFLATGYWTPLYVCHECDWPPCCNPAHLFEGSAKQNYDDAAVKGRSTRGEKVAVSKLTAAQVLEIRRLRASGIKRYIVARQFNIGITHVSRITGKSNCWNHLR